MPDPFPEYEQHDAVALAGLVRSGEMTATEIVETAIHRLETRNPAINAVVSFRLDAARADAARADAARADAARVDAAQSNPGSSGDAPLAGVPFLIKDLTPEKGEPVSYGSVFFRDFVGDVTPESILRFRRAGLISLGRTNTPEFGLLPTTEPVLHGPTRNPWSLEHSAGGSSGGSAAAVAAGIVPMAHASDGGGSIRIPASACGLFGLKPTRGRIPARPASASDHLSVSFAVSRSVRDSAALLDAMAGPLPGSPLLPMPPTGRWSDVLGEDPPPLRIAVTRHTLDGTPVHPECASAVLDTADLLESLGHRVEEAQPDLDGLTVTEAFLAWWKALPEAAFRAILATAEQQPGGRALRRLLGDLRAMRTISRLDRRRSGDPSFEPFTWALVERSIDMTPGELLNATAVLQEATYTLGEFLTGYDLWLTPTLGEPVKRIGELDQTQPFDEFEEALGRYVPFTPLANFAGLPACSVPLGHDRSGLPIGSHFVGRHGDEATLLQLSAQLERARPWAHLRPGG